MGNPKLKKIGRFWGKHGLCCDSRRAALTARGQQESTRMKNRIKFAFFSPSWTNPRSWIHGGTSRFYWPAFNPSRNKLHSRRKSLKLHQGMFRLDIGGKKFPAGVVRPWNEAGNVPEVWMWPWGILGLLKISFSLDNSDSLIIRD